MLNFLREIKHQICTICRFIKIFTLSHLNGGSNRYFLNRIYKLSELMPSNMFRKILLNLTY